MNHAQFRIRAEKEIEAEKQSNREEQAHWRARYCQGPCCTFECCNGRKVGTETDLSC